MAEKLVLGQHLKEICETNFKKNDRKYNDLRVIRFIKQRWYKNRCDIEFCPMKTYEGGNVLTVYAKNMNGNDINKLDYMWWVQYILMLCLNMTS